MSYNNTTTTTDGPDITAFHLAVATVPYLLGYVALFIFEALTYTWITVTFFEVNTVVIFIISVLFTARRWHDQLY